MDTWIASAVDEIAARMVPDLEALVAISSPSGDVAAAEACVEVVGRLAPPEATIERIPCSSPDYAPDAIVRLTGTNADGARLLLVGHLDTVFPHERFRPPSRDANRLGGSGASDMKSGDVLALSLLRALVARRAEFAEVALLLVMDEESRTAPFAHAERFAGWNACLCFEAGDRDSHENEAVIVRRKAAATLRVQAHGRASHSGSAPDLGRNALLALAAVAQAVAAAHDPHGPDRLTAVPTILHSGDASNVVPADGQLLCDLRSDRTGAFEEVRERVPTEVGGARLEPELLRVWPAMDSRAATATLIAATSERLGRPIVAAARGGASDASHLAPGIALTIDGLGPRGSGQHTDDEFLALDSVRPRAEIALALTDAVLRGVR
ncbi:MAG TPA: M20/M25/M40 family metallo-hydrolase [Conexibacter sp.]|jgi:glutamate carboxypeptidase